MSKSCITHTTAVKETPDLRNKLEFAMDKLPEVLPGQDKPN